MTQLELERELERHHAAAFEWTLACCGRNPVDAEDVLQSVYLKILEGRARYGGTAEFKTWLFSVIRNTAVDAKRGRLARFFRLGRYWRQVTACAPVQMDDEPGHSDLHAAVRRVLAALPKRQAEVLQLVFYHELTLEQAAVVMGITIGSVRTHYDRAKKRVRRLLEKSEVFDEAR